MPAGKLDHLRDRQAFALRLILAEVLGTPRARAPHTGPVRRPLPPAPPREPGPGKGEK